MEVHGRQPGRELPHDKYLERQEELRKANSERIRAAREMLVDHSRRQQEKTRELRETRQADQAEAAEQAQAKRAEELRAERRADVLEVSHAAREVTAEDEDRAQRVQELRGAYERGDLNTPERVEQAAQRMLEG